jgi:uncharacterized membrane protein YccC
VPRFALSGAQWRYCTKVGIAAALGFLLAQGGENQYAVYSSITAALIVGTSIGEDLATCSSRVKGTLAGMIAGMLVGALLGPSTLAVALGVTLTALLTLAFGWGVPVARVGVTLCIVTLVAHGANVVEYDMVRALNTLIGVVIGLAVSIFVWPVRSRDEMPGALQRVLEAAATLLEAGTRGDPELRPLQSKLYDAIATVVKIAREAKLERRVELDTGAPEAHALRVVQLGLDVLAAALAEECRVPEAPSKSALDALRRRLDELLLGDGRVG